jgi:tetratricopeptide (TPR) repeat protein
MSLRNILATIAILLPSVFGLPNSSGMASALPSSRAALSANSRRTFPDSQDNNSEKQEAELREAIRQAPTNAAYLSQLGSILAMQNKPGEAMPYFEKALKLNPGDVETRRTLATSYWQLGKLAEAHKNLEIVLKTHPADTLAMLLLGMVCEDLGDDERAANLLAGVIPLVRQRPETIDSLARAYYHLGQTEKARNTLQMLVGHPAGPETVFQGGRLAAEFKDYETAEKIFLSIQTTYPDPATVNYNLALAQFSAMHYTECEKTLLASIGYGHVTTGAYALLGWTYQKQDRLPEMLKAFEKAINLEPDNQAYYIDLGDALAEKKNYGTAIEVAKEAVKRFPSSSRIYSLKGSVELKMYLLMDALNSYSRAVELDPKNPRAALGLALTQWNMDRSEEAAKSFEEGARKFPRDAFFLLKYSLFLLYAPGERDAEQEAKIKALLKRSAELDGSMAETHYQLGNLAMKENKYDEALNELQIAAKLDPELSKAHLALARVYRRAGRAAEAEKETELHRKLKASEEQNADGNAAIGTRHP